MLPKVKKHLKGTKNPEYHFKMPCHFRGQEEAVHWAIKNWIEARYNPECFDPVDYMDPECPLLVRLANQGFRLARIHPKHKLAASRASSSCPSRLKLLADFTLVLLPK